MLFVAPGRDRSLTVSGDADRAYSISLSGAQAAGYQGAYAIAVAYQ
jgi:hypothetical protein